MIIELFKDDIDPIMEIEHAAFPVNLQASRATYLKRFALGHKVLAYMRDRLQGIISFSYGIFDPADPSTIPDNFNDWSTQPVPEQYDSVFIYNLGFVPKYRGKTKVLRGLVEQALCMAMQDGCVRAIAEGPVPSYAGNRHVSCIPEIKKSLDAYTAGGQLPPSELLFRDPHLALYRRLCRCSIIRLMPEFLPADVASGGFRVMLFRDLKNFQCSQG